MNDKPSDTLLSGDNLPFIEDLYGQYLQDPDSVDPSWRPLFEEYFGSGGRANGSAKGRVQPTFQPRSLFAPAPNGAAGPQMSEAEYAEHASGAVVKTPGRSTKFAARVMALVRAHRLHGHLVANIDPLGAPRANDPPELDPARYGFGPDDMDAPVMCEALFGNEEVTLRRVLDRLKELYCGSIGVEFQNIPNAEGREWLRKQIEQNGYAPIDGREEKLSILRDLVHADAFEEFLDKKYVGAKRFSLSGGDSLIPMMSVMLDEAGSLGIGEVIIGMAHRGRLNVLHNIMGKPASAMLSEFEKTPNPEEYLGSSDVKYHMGYSNDHTTRHGKKVHLSLTFNPSHLEFVNPVVIGRTRAKQDRCGDDPGCRTKMMPLLLHGDAAFAGQGVVAETLNLANLYGYNVGGTLHIVINNQVGFTANPEETRSTTYSTDIARILEVPIFHVNGQDPEACARVAKLAARYRQKFQQDVVIDLVCYRKYGHNEGDEPRFTQPVMYERIAETPLVREAYAEELVAEGNLSAEEVQAIWDKRMEEYARVFEEIQQAPKRAEISSMGGVWNDYKGGDVSHTDGIDTSVPMDRLRDLGEKIAAIPDDFEAHRTIRRLFKQRAKMAAGELPLDWGMAEALAFASLVTQGTRVRISGQDSIRGTFSHRHAAITAAGGAMHWPIRHLSEEQAPFDVYNSMLSEAGVLGFEYGYSLDYPDALVAWEAQFGDFANGAQVIIDQFISSGEDKWKRLSGLVMLLPHGYEGQGPEHSSARLERFLQLGAEDNMFVCNLTTPANYFHALRRQVMNPLRKPLIVMSPKSLLRLREATSSLEELASGGFQTIIDDPRPELDPASIERLLLCSGKVYYDLLDHMRSQEIEGTALVRVEQLYPLDRAGLDEIVARYPNLKQVRWVQEEPKNMGSWNYILPHLLDTFGCEHLPAYVGRVESASPATGSKESHNLEQEALIQEAFA